MRQNDERIEDTITADIILQDLTVDPEDDSIMDLKENQFNEEDGDPSELYLGES
jgi:hypothetical protein